MVDTMKSLRPADTTELDRNAPEAVFSNCGRSEMRRTITKHSLQWPSRALRVRPGWGDRATRAGAPSGVGGIGGDAAGRFHELPGSNG